MPEWSYQNGGDWAWFGGRVVQASVKMMNFVYLNEKLCIKNERFCIKNKEFWI